MFGFSVDTSEVTALAAELDNTKAELLAGLRTATQKTTADVERDAKILAPVDTGNLRNGIGSETRDEDDSVVGEVYATASYGPYQEFGTSRMAPHPFLRPALDRHAESYRHAIEGIASRLGRK